MDLLQFLICDCDSLLIQPALRVRSYLLAGCNLSGFSNLKIVNTDFFRIAFRPRFPVTIPEAAHAFFLFCIHGDNRLATQDCNFVTSRKYTQTGRSDLAVRFPRAFLGSPAGSNPPAEAVHRPFGDGSYVPFCSVHRQTCARFSMSCAMATPGSFS